VTFSGTNGTQILGVSFSNTRDLGSFELNNVAFLNNATGAVPEPMTRATMLMGFGAIGCTMRRKNKPGVVRSAAGSNRGAPQPVRPQSHRLGRLKRFGCSAAHRW
jgi:hypothetical protein